MTEERIPLSRPGFGPEEEEQALEALRSGWVTSGPKVKAFESAFAARTATADAVATSSGTSALHLALWSLGLRPGDEVLTPSLTWVSLPNIAHHLGLKPVFCDVDPGTLNIDLAHAATLAGPRTKAIVPVHFAGRPCDMAAIADFAAAHRLTVIEDAAHAIGGRQGGTPIGTHSPLVAFSFHPNKNISTCEGGMVTGQDEERLAWIRQRRYHGVNRDISHSAGASGHAHYDVQEPGLKYIMTDVNAGIGLAQLAKLDDFNRQRGRLARLYQSRLKALADREILDLPLATVGEGDAHAWHLFTARVPDIDGLRDRVMAQLDQHGIGTGLHYCPVHQMTWVRESGAPVALPVTERVGRTIISLPLFPGLTDSQVDRVCDVLEQTLVQLMA